MSARTARRLAIAAMAATASLAGAGLATAIAQDPAIQLECSWMWADDAPISDDIQWVQVGHAEDDAVACWSAS